MYKNIFNAKFQNSNHESVRQILKPILDLNISKVQYSDNPFLKKVLSKLIENGKIGFTDGIILNHIIYRFGKNNVT